MKREIVVNVQNEQMRIAMLEENRLVELHLDQKGQKRLVGNIYKGKVSNVLPGMEAVFVDIGTGREAFLPLLEPPEGLVLEETDFLGWVKKKVNKLLKIPPRLKKGQDILVQIIKGPLGKKAPRLSPYISLTGRNLVFMPTVDRIGVSKRIHSHKEKSRLRTLIKNIKPRGQGFIVRTVGEGIEADELLKEAGYLIELWKKLGQKTNTTPAPAIIYEEPPLLHRLVRDWITGQDRVIIDSLDEAQRLAEFFDSFDDSLKKTIVIYQNKEPIFHNYQIEKQLSEVLKKRIALRSGGYLVVDEAEALTAIDVNSGKFVGRKNLEETAFQVNLEAAQEIGRLVRLRGIGGIIIIDFISMEFRKHEEEIFRALQYSFRFDKTRINFIPFTQFGLVEMTRQRTGPSLLHNFTDFCPHCQGLGKVFKSKV